MFDAIMSKISAVIRNTVRAIGAVTRNHPWLIAAAILAVFLVW